mgnify:CR=1 FL=1
MPGGGIFFAAPERPERRPVALAQFLQALKQAGVDEDATAVEFGQPLFEIDPSGA